MYSDHQLKWRAIIFLLVAITTIIDVLVMHFIGVDLSILLALFTKIGVISTVVWLIWWFFSRHAWRYKCIRRCKFLVTTPDLNGTWFGKAISSYDCKEREMTLRIHQDLVEIIASAYGSDNEAECFSVRLLSDIKEQTFKLVYLYRAKRKIEKSIPGDQHEGVVVLTLDEDHEGKKLIGYYLNDRDPQPRKADVTLKWVSHETKGRKWIP